MNGVWNWQPFAHIEPYGLSHWHSYFLHAHNNLFCLAKMSVHTMEHQTLKVQLSSISMWIITLPNKIKQQAFMLHLDGWGQQPTYWWHTINPLFFGIQNICRWEGKNNETTNAISHLLYVPNSFQNQPNIKVLRQKHPLHRHIHNQGTTFSP
jgi:hypothetical protein